MMSSPVTENEDRLTDESRADEIQQPTAPLKPKPPDAIEHGSGSEDTVRVVITNPIILFVMQQSVAQQPKPPEEAFRNGNNNNGTTKPNVLLFTPANVSANRLWLTGPQGTSTSKPRQPAKMMKKPTKNPFKTISLRCPVPNCATMIRNVTKDVNQTRKSLNLHIKECHKIVPYPVCLDCNAKYCNLRSHIERHHRTNAKLRFRCRHCPTKSFRSYQRLKAHHHRMHAEGCFRCLHCPYTRSRRFEVRRHTVRSHKTIPRKQCAFEGCDSVFRYKHELRTHHLLHLNLRHVHCDWPGCTFQTSFKPTALEHVKSKHFRWRKAKWPKDDDKEALRVNDILRTDAARYVKVLGLGEAVREANRLSKPATHTTQANEGP